MAARPIRDRTKLPAWAQRELDRLEQDLAWYKGKLDAIESRATNVWVESVGDYSPLAPDSRVSFTTAHDPKNYHERYDVRLERGALVVSADAMEIRPIASNVVRISLGVR